MRCEKNMAYKVVFRGNSSKEFESLTQGQKKAFAGIIRVFENNPSAEGSKTLVRYAPLRRVKTGNIRVIYDLEPDTEDRLSLSRIGADHSIYDDLADLYREYLSDIGERPD
jgi:mRNA-degrading endonuclease RelE of RelBE toxin-antitoxin system